MQAVGAATRRVASARSATLRLSVPAIRTYATATHVNGEKDPQLGDYPQLPYESKQRRPARGWEDPQMRRNFGETPHEQEEIVSMWGPDAPHVAPDRAARNFGIAVAVFTTLALIAKAGTPARPSAPREYPYSGLVTELGGLEENKANPETLDEE